MSLLDTQITTSEEERDALRALSTLLIAEKMLRIVGAGGQEITLPSSVLYLIQRVVDELVRGNAISIIPAEQELTTHEAADLLNISRPHLIKLLDRGAMPYHKVGTHRRIRFDDVLRYKHQRDAEKLQAIKELAQMSQDLGLYEVGS